MPIPFSTTFGTLPFNNHWQGYAPRNAVGMMKTLELPIEELPIQTTLPDDV